MFDIDLAYVSNEFRISNYLHKKKMEDIYKEEIEEIKEIAVAYFAFENQHKQLTKAIKPLLERYKRFITKKTNKNIRLKVENCLIKMGKTIKNRKYFVRVSKIK